MSLIPWNRDMVAYCSCSALRYAHTHCPCHNCNDKAVPRSTEYHHWREMKLAYRSTTHAQMEDMNVEATNPISIDSSALASASIDSPPSTTDTALAEENTRHSDDNNISGTMDISQLYTVCSQTRSEISNQDELCASKNLEDDILKAVLIAFELMDETNASQKSFMNILNYGRDLYCKASEGNEEITKQWPKSWSACMAILKENGYKEPSTYYICLNECHPNQWSVLNTPDDLCKYCKQQGSIQYHYISLTERVQRWYSSKSL